jgi:hypothetical protein
MVSSAVHSMPSATAEAPMALLPTPSPSPIPSSRTRKTGVTALTQHQPRSISSTQKLKVHLTRIPCMPPPVGILTSKEAYLRLSRDGSSSGSNKPRNDMELLMMYGTSIRTSMPRRSLLLTPSLMDTIKPCRLNSSSYDALETSHREHGVVTGLTRLTPSPLSEPVALADPYESAPSAPRPRSSSAALERKGSLPQVSCLRLHCFARWLTWTPSRYSHFHLASHGHKRLASYVSSREPSPASCRRIR